jgi:predicted NBD/HSP70 family sugar kinase/putative N-acetylmannosamine-6-phosphate epimerase
MISDPEIVKRLQGGLIVSCQAPEGDPFSQPDLHALFARAAVNGGAAAIRTEGPDSVRAIKAAVSVPVIGIRKRMMGDGFIMITPTNEDAEELVAAGADIVAIDCTSRGQRHGALERIPWIRSRLKVPVWADISTVAEAVAAANAGADAVLSTLRGYTEDTAHVLEFEASFIADLARSVGVPVIAEGRIHSAEDVAAAVDSGAISVVVGTAITRPEEITRRLASGMGARPPRAKRHFVGIDLGGTNIKSGISSGEGELVLSSVTPTRASAGRAALLSSLVGIARARLEDARARGIAIEALGVATAGWVDPRDGRVLFATDNLPGWSGVELGRELEEALGLPVAVENDGNAQAVAEREYGAGRGVDNFVCVTLGTGVGGGCFVNGRLNHGAHFLANGIGHMILQHGGLACTCGRRGCFEAYANEGAFLELGKGAWASSEDLIASAGRGDPAAREAVKAHAIWVGAGCESIQSIFDPEVIVLSGGLAQGNPLLPQLVGERLRSSDRAWKLRPTRVEASALGYHGGVLGAAAVAQAASPGMQPQQRDNFVAP